MRRPGRRCSTSHVLLLIKSCSPNVPVRIANRASLIGTGGRTGDASFAEDRRLAHGPRLAWTCMDHRIPTSCTGSETKHAAACSRADGDRRRSQRLPSQLTLVDRGAAPRGCCLRATLSGSTCTGLGAKGHIYVCFARSVGRR